MSRIVSRILDGVPHAETGEVRQSVEATNNETHAGEEEKEEPEQVQENNNHDKVDVECEVLEEEEEEEKELEEEEDEDECIDEDDGDIDLFTAAAGSSGSEEHLIDDKESWNQCLVRVQHKYGEVLVVNEMADTKSSEAS